MLEFLKVLAAVVACGVLGGLAVWALTLISDVKRANHNILRRRLDVSIPAEQSKANAKKYFSSEGEK